MAGLPTKHGQVRLSFSNTAPKYHPAYAIKLGQETRHNAELQALGKATFELGYLTQFDVSIILTFCPTEKKYMKEGYHPEKGVQ